MPRNEGGHQEEQRDKKAEPPVSASMTFKGLSIGGGYDNTFVAEHGQNLFYFEDVEMDREGQNRWGNREGLSALWQKAHG